MPEFDAYVKPIIERVREKAPEMAEDLDRLVDQRSWYFVPVDLATLPEGRIGVAFRTEQLALQNQKEVWVSSKAFQSERMDVISRVRLLVHELVMGIRISEGVDQLLKSIAKNGQQGQDAGWWAEEQLRRSHIYDLSPEDYASIRHLTSQLVENKEPVESKGFVDHVRELGIKDYLDIQESKRVREVLEKKISAAQLIEMFKSRQMIGNLPARMEDGRRCLFDPRKDPKGEIFQFGLVINQDGVRDPVIVFNLSDFEMKSLRLSYLKKDRRYVLHITEKKEFPLPGDIRFRIRIIMEGVLWHEIAVVREGYFHDIINEGQWIALEDDSHPLVRCVQ